MDRTEQQGTQTSLGAQQRQDILRNVEGLWEQVRDIYGDKAGETVCEAFNSPDPIEYFDTHLPQASKASPTT